MVRVKIISSLLLLGLSSVARSQEPEPKGFGLAAPAKKSSPIGSSREGAKEPSQSGEKSGGPQKSRAASQPLKFGVGLDLGSNATYGNALKASFMPLRVVDVQFGAGYNTTGAKLGAGGAFVFDLGKQFGFNAGGAFVRSAGTSGKLSLPGKFTPEGGAEEKVTISRTFKISPANYASAFVGGHYAFTLPIRVTAQVNYNKVISGNKLETSGNADYDTPIDPTNEAEVNTEFEKKAEEKLNITGLGISVGLQYRF